MGLDTAYQAVPLGRAIPDAPHAVSVSMPTWQDVIGYETGDAATMAALKGGYPRFVLHPSVEALFAELSARFAGAGERAIALPTPDSAERCAAYLARQGVATRREAFRGLGVLILAEAAWPIARQFWQHAGEIVSSRRAEAALGDREPGSPEALAELAARVAEVAGVPAADVSLHPSGMAAIYRALRLVTELTPDRPTVQFGFPYLDSLKLQERLGTGCRFFPVGDDAALAELEAALAANEVGAVFCEVPGNPLFRTVDLVRLAAATRAAGVPLVVDDSMATFANHDFTPYADVLVSSLTKSFQGSGLAMGGALVLNAASAFHARFSAAIAADAPTLFADDAAVIAEGARDFLARTRRTNRTAEALAEHLAAHPGIARVYFPKFVTPHDSAQSSSW